MDKFLHEVCGLGPAICNVQKTFIEKIDLVFEK